MGAATIALEFAAGNVGVPGAVVEGDALALVVVDRAADQVRLLPLVSLILPLARKRPDHCVDRRPIVVWLGSSRRMGFCRQLA